MRREVAPHKAARVGRVPVHGMRDASTDALVDEVLGAVHERCRTRCERAKILAVLQDELGAYDEPAM